MRNILIIGAGRSATSLIQYILNKSQEEDLLVTIGDISIQNARRLAGGHPNAEAYLLDIHNEHDRREAISDSDIVISMLPARYHIEVARDCLEFGKNLVTASYVSDEMQSMHHKVEAKGLIFMNEIGVDPGIDHMSAMQVIDRIRDGGGKMLMFESFTGGLVAPESDDNLWNYKFTWNPRNVVLAGQGGAAEFIQEGTYKYIPYHRLFRRKIASANTAGISNDGELRGGTRSVVRFLSPMWWKKTKMLLDQSGPVVIVGGLRAQRYLQ